ncbi:right-handed parallel beta-helix repeat-containing protein [Blautia massiliensis (ex Durand et al. 2017)]|uniref:right-handed parallel beta-helix repeat-containing protein n=1 Tax=Blautia massiliensis (ex Durand et al. 2017) TaxID=1737424 RepID=UPI00242F0EF7|nr:right-handed parallel beta-helix repeat-containing protein [Blautia massiliensis (ex Durand et al. 2017)]MDD6547714.1 right-handed parallel beta-helix repeat-containing protein [Blautia massiliensis (ex Durand et al. 2017)]
MKRKIMACILAAALGITGVSFPAAAKTVSVGKNITVNVKNPLDELRAQEAAMQQQEELEEEENMPEQDLDPLVLDNDGSEDIQTADGSISRELPADFSEGTENGDNGSEELQLQQENGNVENVAEPDNNKADECAGQAQTDFTDDANAAGDFSAGDASDGELGTYQTVTLEVEEGQDITAPWNTLFLELKDQATDENPCKIIIPPGNYELTGTLCMYSNMYLYARDANITKTSTTKHLILRLGNTKDSEGGFVGFYIGHATNVMIKNATFLNNLKSHFLEFGGVKNAKITGCTFSGYYKNYVEGGQECIQIDCCTDESNVFPQYRPYDGTTCEDFVIDGNVFEDVFTGLGTHSMMSGKTYKRITVTNNTFHNVKKRCIRFMNYEDSTAENNTMVNVGNGVDISSVSSNTHQTPGYDDGPDMLKNRNLRVAGNYISLARTTSIGGIAWICSGIKVSGYNMKKDGAVLPKKIYPVKGVTVEDNQISGYGNGISMSLTDTDTVTDNQVTMKKTSSYSNFGIYAQDSRGSVISRNTVSGTANTGIYLSGSVYAAGSEQRNLVEQNTVSGAGGDGIYLQSVNTSSTAQKNTVKSAAGSGIRVNAGKNNNVLGNTCLSNKNHGVKIEYVVGRVRVKSNRVTSNAKSGILLWKSKVSEVSGNRAEKNRGNGVYAYASVIPVMKKNTFCENGKVQAVYVKSCKGWTGINRPSCRAVTSRSTAISGTASGSQTVIAYARRSGKQTKLGVSSVNKKKQYVIKIKKQKKNTALKLVSKDKYGNTVTVNTVVK